MAKFALLTVALPLPAAVIRSIGAASWTIGRVSALSVTGAWESSRGTQKVTDLSAGVGLSVGIILLGASLRSGTGDFGPWLENVWLTTPFAGFVPPPIGLMELLVPRMAEAALMEYFAGFSVATDVMILVLGGLLGVLSMTLRSVTWESHDGQKFRVALPVLIAAGMALVFAIPMLLLWLFAEQSG